MGDIAIVALIVLGVSLAIAPVVVVNDRLAYGNWIWQQARKERE